MEREERRLITAVGDGIYIMLGPRNAAAAAAAATATLAYCMRAIIVDGYSAASSWTRKTACLCDGW
jgi:hypothetical protein